MFLLFALIDFLAIWSALWFPFIPTWAAIQQNFTLILNPSQPRDTKVFVFWMNFDEFLIIDLLFLIPYFGYCERLPKNQHKIASLSGLTSSFQCSPIIIAIISAVYTDNWSGNFLPTIQVCDRNEPLGERWSSG